MFSIEDSDMDLLMYFYEFEIQTDGNDIESRSNEQ